MQYLNARDYDRELGIFIQPDWFEVTELGVGTNRYSYSFNNPINLMDPGGNETAPKSSAIGGTLSSFFESLFSGWGGSSADADRNARVVGNQIRETPIVNGYPTAASALASVGGADEMIAAIETGDYASIAIATGLAVVPVGKVALAARAAGRGSVWALGWAARGAEIEKRLGGNLTAAFPSIVRFAAGVATSIKSVDLAAPTYQSIARLERKLTGYVDSVSAFSRAQLGGVRVGGIGREVTASELQIAIPSAGTSAQQAAIARVIGYGLLRENPVTVLTTIMR